MVVSDVLSDVKRLVAETCAIDPATIRDDGRLVQYGVDSVRAMDLLVALEEHFGLDIPDTDAARLAGIKDVVAYVEKKRTK